MINLRQLLTKILQSPRVIETGSVRQLRQPNANYSPYANWNWKIWSNGEYELYCELESYTWSLTAQSGNGYYTSFGLDLPDRFAGQKVDYVAINRKQAVSDNGGNALITFSISNIYAGSVSFYIYTTLSFSATFTISVYMRGKF